MSPWLFIGTAGWAADRSIAPGTHPEQTALMRYAEVFDVVEINSTFYRLPRSSTLERWRDSTPARFRFTLKVPQSITHEARLVGVGAELRGFCRLVETLKPKLGPLLVQLPPSLEFDARTAGRFLGELSKMHEGPVVLEARHLTWFSERASALLRRHAVARVAADPALCPDAEVPGGVDSPRYHRWHGSPRMYFSPYDDATLSAFAERVRATSRVRTKRPIETYCIFDNTGLGAAARDALSFARKMGR